MPDLAPASALGELQLRELRHSGLILQERDGVALASLALRRGTARPAPFGLALPEAGKWAAGSNGISAFWIGPEQWMIEAEDAAARDFATELAGECPGLSITEQTDAFARFEILSGAGDAPILALLERLVNLDPARLGPGSATRAGLAHMSVFVIRRAPTQLAVLGIRSAAASLWHALATAILRLPETEA